MRRLASVVLTGVLLAACGGDAFSPEGVSGVYNLESVNGNRLPAEIELPPERFVFTAGSVTLNADGTFSASLTSETTTEGITDTETSTDSGTFTLVAPSTIRFTEAGGETFSGTLEGGRLTLLVDVTLVYRK